MNQQAELTRVKARIKALTDKTVANGCTEAEALSAAEMVGRLLERYSLRLDSRQDTSADTRINLTLPNSPAFSVHNLPSFDLNEILAFFVNGVLNAFNMRSAIESIVGVDGTVDVKPERFCFV